MFRDCLRLPEPASFGRMTSSPDSLRPALAALAAAPTTTTVRRLWKALTPEERATGIEAALTDDPEGWVKSSTRGAIALALKFRPQTVSTWPRTKLVSEAARLPLDDAQLLSAYLVDLHLGHRRAMMGAFLDALGIPNDEGRIDSEATTVPVQDPSALSDAADKLVAQFGTNEVVTYLLTLLLQDGATWQGVTGWLERRAATGDRRPA